MRVNLITHRLRSFRVKHRNNSAFPDTRPHAGYPATDECPTDSAALLRLLRQQSDLPGTVLQSFENSLRAQLGARLLGVELGDTVLTKMGYFID